MVLKVEIISGETIKPSSPTPLHLKSYRLSWIDQGNMPHPPISFLLFYSGANADPVEQRGSLKKSLSETLTRFYPLAGKIKDNLTIGCDDYGSYYLETRVSCHLSEVLTNPEANTLKKFLPSYDLHFRSGSSSGTTTSNNELDLKDLIQLVIQVNIFDCSGMAIGISMCHKIGDLASMTTFLNSWARTSCRGTNSTADDQEMVTPYFYSASLFPPQKTLASCPFKKLSARNKHVTRRFVFDASRIAALKAKATNPLYVNNPTRVESVTALIWKCASRVGITKSSESATRQSVAFVPVNLRGRRIPPMPEHLIGNLVQLAVASKTTGASASAKEEDLSYLVQLVRDGISKINNDRVKEMQAYSDGGFGEFFREVYGRYRKGEVDLNTIISWCRFPFYEADFGWTKPHWVCCVQMEGKNVHILMDTKDGNGVEAWVTFGNQHQMDEFSSLIDCEVEISAETERNSAT